MSFKSPLTITISRAGRIPNFAKVLKNASLFWGCNVWENAQNSLKKLTYRIGKNDLRCIWFGKFSLKVGNYYNLYHSLGMAHVSSQSSSLSSNLQHQQRKAEENKTPKQTIKTSKTCKRLKFASERNFVGILWHLAWAGFTLLSGEPFVGKSKMPPLLDARF